MIVFPKNWKDISNNISLDKIESTILEILFKINCNHLSLSGGLDSSLLLYYLSKVHKKINVYTIGYPSDHPDIEYSKCAVAYLNNNNCNITHHIFIPENSTDSSSDEIVEMFYEYVFKYTDTIIAGDGVDEFNCGYYDHQKFPNEDMYYNYIRKLCTEHLIPLNKNSKSVKVYLPYIDKEMVLLWTQIPINNKVTSSDRKLIIKSLAYNNLPQNIIERWKYGFCDALHIKSSRF